MMNQADINTKDQAKPGAGGWLTIGMAICIALFVIAVPIVIILSLIPLYVNKSVSSSVNNYASTSAPLTHSLSSSFLPSSGASSLSATNLDSMARQLESAYGLETGTLTVSSGGLSSFPKSKRRRRQNHREKRDKPSCEDLGAGGSVMDCQLSINFPKRLGNSAAAKLKFFASVISALSKPLTGIALTVSFNDGSTSTITFTACKKNPSSTIYSNSTEGCTNGVRNGLETDVDCGGICPKKCADAKKCKVATDCTNGICGSDSKCVAAKCTDGVANADETDVDCGGSCPAKCADTKTCKVAADCSSGICTNLKCVAPSCSDGLKNSNETDVDCGGNCGATCTANKICRSHLDCATMVCYNLTCADCKRYNTSGDTSTPVIASAVSVIIPTTDLNATWLCKAVYFTPSAGGTLNFRLRLRNPVISATNLLLVDDISMYAANNGSEMLQNGGFETGTAGAAPGTPWSVAKSIIAPADDCPAGGVAVTTSSNVIRTLATTAHNGSNYIEQGGEANSCGDYLKYTDATTTISLSQSYVLSFWIKRSAATSQGEQVKVTFAPATMTP